jgi:hypothetical protein
MNGGSVAPSTSSTATTTTTTTTSAGDSSSKAAASYFLNKKDRSGSTPMEPLMLSDSECTPDQYRAMYERAVKDNQLLVKKYNERAAECKKLKKELEQKTHAHAPDSSSSRVSRVVSRDQRMSMAMSTQLGGQLGNLLTLVQNLDEQIKASEAARQYAEEKLIEMALQKIDVTEALKKVDDALEKVAARMRGGGNVDKERVAEIITTIRRDVLGAQVDEPAPAAAAAAEPAAAKAAPRGGLLSQIRAGVQLSRVDVEKLKEARRKERIRTARESGVMMQSLEQTLRSALEMRQFELNPDDPNTVGGEDWD